MPVLEKVRWWRALEATSTDEVQVPGVQVESELVIWTSGFWGLLLSLWVQKMEFLICCFPVVHQPSKHNPC